MAAWRSQSALALVLASGLLQIVVRYEQSLTFALPQIAVAPALGSCMLPRGVMICTNLSAGHSPADAWAERSEANLRAN